MGYYTYHSLEVKNGDEMEIIKDLRENNANAQYALNEFGEGEESIKWYDHTEELTEFSKKYPSAVFKLHGEGEESGDIWDEWFHNGRSHLFQMDTELPKFTSAGMIRFMNNMGLRDKDVTQDGKGHWFQTFTGEKFHPMDPKQEDINIEDIVGPLSRICRFGGHCDKFYSVAQHSLLVLEIGRRLISDLSPYQEMQFLLHDATEAYIGDMIKPLKVNVPIFNQVEEQVWQRICEKWALDPEWHPRLKECDIKALIWEHKHIMKQGPRWFFHDQGVDYNHNKEFKILEDGGKQRFQQEFNDILSKF